MAGRVLLVTGSSGLVGSAAVRWFASRGWRVVGIDNNMRRDFFGAAGDTTWNLRLLREEVPGFEHCELDVRDADGVARLFRELRPDAVVHCAGQPSHDLAKTRVFDDFTVNANGTLSLLEATRHEAPEAPFVFLSTNKVYGDAPNEVPRVELATRFEYRDEADWHGIHEGCRLDRSMHSLFGVSKAAADLMVQEYGRYFGLRTVCLRMGCVTGAHHSAVQLHGFLAYLARTALAGETYTVFGYGGKQVRDQIHADDVCSAIECLLRTPVSGEVYNLGGGRESHASLIECVHLLEELLDRSLDLRFVDEPRAGDHACYVSDVRRFRRAFPEWSVTRRVPDLLEELVRAGLGSQPQRVPA